jgi:arylsulfate sulfotransferase
VPGRPSPRSRRLGLLLLLGLFGLACAPSRGQLCSPAARAPEVRVSATLRDGNPLIADTTVSLDRAVPVYLEYGSSELGWLRTPTTAAADRHTLPLLRLLPGKSYELRAFALDGDGCPAAMNSAEIRTEGLPRLLRKLEVDVTGEPTVPLVIVEYRPENENRWLVALDHRGQIRWLHRLQRPASGDAKISFVRRSNGNFLYLDWSTRIEEITPDGRTVRKVEFPGPVRLRRHHDFAELPDGRILLLGEAERDLPRADGQPGSIRLVGDTLRLLDLDTREEREVWSAFDHLDPSQRVQHWLGRQSPATQVEEWTHANTVSLGRNGEVLLSIRFLNQIVALSPDLTRVLWRLGGPGSSFSFPDPGDQFYGQHATHQLANGNLLLFDNGNYRPEGEYSRALELELDHERMTARKAWEFRPRPDVYSPSVSNALRLDNGNTLVTFGFRGEGPDEPVMIFEAQPDGTALGGWALQYPDSRLTLYRGYPLTSLAGETPTEPTPIGR